MNVTREVMNKVGEMEYKELYYVAKNGTIERFGFYAKQEDRTYAIYKPQVTTIKLSELDAFLENLEKEFDMGPGEIKTGVTFREMCQIVANMGEIFSEPLSMVNAMTPHGWYVDKSV